MRHVLTGVVLALLAGLVGCKDEPSSTAVSSSNALQGPPGPPGPQGLVGPAGPEGKSFGAVDGTRYTITQPMVKGADGSAWLVGWPEPFDNVLGVKCFTQWGSGLPYSYCLPNIGYLVNPSIYADSTCTTRLASESQPGLNPDMTRAILPPAAGNPGAVYQLGDLYTGPTYQKPTASDCVAMPVTQQMYSIGAYVADIPVLALATR